MLVEHKVVEDFDSAIHLIGNFKLRNLERFLRRDEATFDEQLLQLQHVIPEVFVLLQKCVFVLGLAELEELLSQRGNGCLLLFLETFKSPSRKDVSKGPISNALNALWQPKAVKDAQDAGLLAPRRRRENPITLSGKYHATWRDFSSISAGPGGQFRFLAWQIG